MANNKSTKMGMNRTGTQMSPQQSEAMVEGVEKLQPKSSGNGAKLDSMRSTYISEAEPVGSVPIPGSVKGAATAIKEKVKGNSGEVLIDKLGERLAFERSGVRLYDLFILKCQAAGNGIIPMDDLKHIRDEELQHFKLVEETMRSIGADPTAQTPSADVSGVASIGIVQVLSDPRTTIPQSLEAILTAELVDNAAWELLITLADGMGMDDAVSKFQRALEEENEHLSKVKQWLEEAVMAESGA